MNNFNSKKYWENFNEKCPDFFQFFFGWLKNQQKKEDWDSLFDRGDDGYPMPDIYDLPLTFQFGLISLFVQWFSTDQIFDYKIESGNDDMKKFFRKFIRWSIKQQKLYNSNMISQMEDRLYRKSQPNNNLKSTNL